jgi:hypothetical protein
MAKLGCTAEDAQRALAAADGVVSRAAKFLSGD